MSTDNEGVLTGELRSIYREPSQVVIDKAIDHVDAGVRGFIARSPLFVFATTDGTTTDASPRGGPLASCACSMITPSRSVIWSGTTGSTRTATC